jgi:hypothetical protein
MLMCVPSGINDGSTAATPQPTGSPGRRRAAERVAGGDQLNDRPLVATATALTGATAADVATRWRERRRTGQLCGALLRGLRPGDEGGDLLLRQAALRCERRDV